MKDNITWGHCKGKRGYWYWGRDGHLKFKASEQAASIKSLQIIKDIEPFRNVAIDGRQIIGGRRQKRDMMRAHGIEEAGDINPKSAAPHYDAKAHQRSVVNDIKRAMHQHGLGD